MEVVSAPSGAPRLNLTGRAATLATDNHVTNVQLSLSHDGGQAIAFVVAEGSAS
jgi:holo-[acyl-carrier protein] synthase